MILENVVFGILILSNLSAYVRFKCWFNMFAIGAIFGIAMITNIKHYFP